MDDVWLDDGEQVLLVELDDAPMRRRSSCSVGASSLIGALNMYQPVPVRLDLEAVPVGQADHGLDLFGASRQHDGCRPRHEVAVLRPDQLRQVLECVAVEHGRVTRDVLRADDVLERAVGLVGDLGRARRLQAGS